MKNVIDRLFMAMDIKVIAATADAGGGGSIDNIRPELIRLGIMDKNGKFTNCVQHSFNKAIEIPIKETMGGEGLGVRSPTQMVFVFSTLMDHLRSKGGRDTLNSPDDGKDCYKQTDEESKPGEVFGCRNRGTKYST